jgi:hypothetical protein
VHSASGRVIQVLSPFHSLTVFDVDSREDNLLDLLSRITHLDTFTWIGCLELPKTLLQVLPTRFLGISLRVIRLSAS